MQRPGVRVSSSHTGPLSSYVSVLHSPDESQKIATSETVFIKTYGCGLPRRAYREGVVSQGLATELCDGKPSSLRRVDAFVIRSTGATHCLQVLLVIPERFDKKTRGHHDCN